MAPQAGIADLPNEILISILSSFSTLTLLPIALTSHRFYNLILRILQHRLLDAAQLKDHQLILECFHPSTKLSTPYLFCTYRGTYPLDSSVNKLCASKVGEDGQIGGLETLSKLYSHFRPLKPDTDRTAIRSHPAGGSFTRAPNGLVDNHDEFVCQSIHLESHELFSQLCTITNLVKVGPKRGLFLSCVNISEGLTRIWRDWLAENVGREEKAEQSSDRILWADCSKTVGMRMRVVERDDESAPVLLRKDEDAPVSYILQYEELVIKSSSLLLNVEQSLEQEVSHSGKAIVIGSWDQ